MPVEIVMPAMEWGQQSATLLRWMKNEGEHVVAGEPLMEIETDKVTVEIEAPGSGTLAHLTARAGDEVPVGQVIALLLGEGETPPLTEEAALPTVAQKALVGAPSQVSAEPTAAPLLTPASPKARRLAGEYGLRIDGIAGSGPEGAVLAADIEAAHASSPEAPQPDEEWTIVPLEGIRRTIAERLQASWAAPHISLTISADMTSALRLLKERQATLRRELTLTALLTTLLAPLLLEHPRLNAQLIDGTLRLSHSAHLGIAVALPDGLIVPVIKDAERKNLLEIQTELTDRVERARVGTLLPSEVRGGTFTLSNLGMFGIEHFTAILNPPEVALLAVGTVRETPWAVGGELSCRPVMQMTLIADHRAVDGAVAGAFLAALKQAIENPALQVRDG